MSQPLSQQVTALLTAWRGGDGAAENRLFHLIYGDLHRLARRHMAQERPGHTLQATALLHEAYLRLIEIERVQWQDRAHFLAVAARVMRRILVDAARKRQYQKRGGDPEKISFDEGLLVSRQHRPNLVALNDALGALASVDARKSRVVELRFFGGLNAEETATVLGVSADTVLRDWKMAKTWLLREMARGRSGPRPQKPDPY